LEVEAFKDVAGFKKQEEYTLICEAGRESFVYIDKGIGGIGVTSVIRAEVDYYQAVN
jgi:hypothetical protein